jgi:hypothetical protein
LLSRACCGSGIAPKNPIMSNTIELDVLSIYFSHSKIRNRFTGCSKLLQETLDELCIGTLQIAEIPLISVIYDGSRYFSLNNRRLWVFKEMAKKGLLTKIAVNLKKPVTRSELKLCQNQLSLNAKACLK